MRVNIPISGGERLKLLLGGMLCGGAAFYLLTLPNGNAAALVIGIILAVLGFFGFKAGITGRQIL